MNILSRLRLRTKLALLMGLSALALIASIGIAASVMHRRMIDDRIDKLRAVVQTTVGLAQSLENQVIGHQLTREQALTQFRDAAHTIRFDGGNGYIVGQTLDSIVVFHGASPESEGKPSPATTASGISVTSVIRDVLKNANEGFVTYSYVKPGETQPQQKVAYVERFPPWNLVFLAGAYTDDLDAAFRGTLEELAALGGAILLATLLVAWLINRDITGSLSSLKAAMASLSQGDLEIPIPGTDRRDEVGAMANAVLIFKDGMRQANRLAAEQQTERTRARATRIAALLAMAETIEAESREAMTEVASLTAGMSEAANNMCGSAGRTGAAAESAAAAAGKALSNAQTVASAAEQLAASIREIGGQVGQSNQVVARAVEAGRATRETMEALNEQVGRIGSVADMISEIAAKTNLLALNATIEAARAGEAGKGFAVVASEVKQLATQTARSTEQISRHITEVRNATGASVAAVGRIEATIGEIDAIAGSIAAAVEEQSAATAEIARNVTETAAAADEMTERTREVSAEADKTGRDATEVLNGTTALTATMEGLQRALIRVVRTSTSEVDRRQLRRRPCHVEATIVHDGRSEAVTLHDISERGCYAVTKSACEPGQRIEIILQRLGRRLQGRAVARSEQGLYVNFTDDGLSAAEADRISVTTITELVKITKDDHRSFVKRVVDAVAAGEASHGGIANQHNCRLGRWYDSLTDAATLALPSFQAIAQPHHAVHECGHKILAAVTAQDIAAAQRYLAELHQHSERVLGCLDDFGREYSATMAQQRSEAAEAA